MLRPVQLLYFVYAAIVFIALMIPAFITAIIASFFGRIRGGNIINRTCTIWADIWFPLAGIFHRNIYESPPRKEQPYIYVANHISYLDAALIVKVIRTPLRSLGKVELGKIPLFGLIYRYAVVSVDRSSPENRARSISLLKSYLRKGISVLVFPEGTFNESHEPLLEFYDGAFRIAIETGTPIKPLLLLDTYARLPYHKFLPLNPGRSRAVFLGEISTEGLASDDIPQLKAQVHAIMAAKLREYKADWIQPA